MLHSQKYGKFLDVWGTSYDPVQAGSGTNAIHEEKAQNQGTKFQMTLLSLFTLNKPVSSARSRDRGMRGNLTKDMFTCMTCSFVN